MGNLISCKDLSLNLEIAAQAGIAVALESAGGFTMNREI
jgi:hypothetical protein